MKSRVIVLGITGSFASGKTTVARMFKRLGAGVINADRIYHDLIKPKKNLYKKIVSAFGKEILQKNGQIDRRKLGRIVFYSNPLGLKRLCRITHPAIIRKMKNKLSQLKHAGKGRIIIIDVPLLIEAGLIKMADKLIVVKTSRDRRIKRVSICRGISRKEAIRRIKAQVSEAKKIEYADYVIDNNGSFKETEQQVENIWQQLSIN